MTASLTLDTANRKRRKTLASERNVYGTSRRNYPGAQRNAPTAPYGDTDYRYATQGYSASGPPNADSVGTSALRTRRDKIGRIVGLAEKLFAAEFVLQLQVQRSRRYEASYETSPTV